ncbi:MAG: M48 family metalloprotease [Verrucomicrobia bacterium]|nr:M48 family metalloprotease [Verrucomicrobiota bacterium]
MNSLLSLAQRPTVVQLGWVLVHFLWQGAVLAGLFAVARHLLRTRSAQCRYLAGCLTLLLMAAAPVITFCILEPQLERSTSSAATLIAPTEGAASLLAMGGDAATGTASGLTIFLDRLALTLEGAMPWLVALWLAGVMALSFRIAVAWTKVRRCRTRRTDAVDPIWLERLAELRSRLGINRPVRLLKSALVQVPTVIGWFRPVILLPASSLTGLSPAQLELVLAHELAHVRRGDYWINLLQVAMETLLFYHPAVWWVSACVREDREHCCDDLAVSVCGNRVAFAHALATLEELRGVAAQTALAAGGGSLLKRVRHILGLPTDAGPRSAKAMAGGTLFVLGAAAMLAALVYYAATPKQFQSACRIAVKEDLPDGSADNRSHDPNWVQTEIETLRSKAVLYGVVDNLGLTKQWAGRYGQSGELKKEQTYLLLKRMVTVQQLRASSLLEIRVTSQERDEATKLANAIAETYANRRWQVRRQFFEEGIAVLRKHHAAADDQVRAVQERVNEIKDKLGISDSEAASPYQTSTLEPETLRRMEASSLEAQARLASLRTSYERMAKLTLDELKQAIHVIYPDPELSDLLRNEKEAEQKLATLKASFGANTPQLLETQRLYETVTNQVGKRLNGVLMGLKHKVDASQTEVDALLKQIEEVKYGDRKKSIERRPYFEAKRDLEVLQTLRDKLHMQIVAQEIDVAVPKRRLVEVIDTAEPALRPVRPNPGLALALFALGSLFCLSGVVLFASSRRSSTLVTQSAPA